MIFSIEKKSSHPTVLFIALLVLGQSSAGQSRANLIVQVPTIEDLINRPHLIIHIMRNTPFELRTNVIMVQGVYITVT